MIPRRARLLDGEPSALRLDGSSRVALAGAVSGGVWHLLALAFDKGLQDFNYPVIPIDSWLDVVIGWFAAAITGAVIAAAFQRPMLRGSRVAFFTLPILTLPAALTIYSTLIWLSRLGLGSNEGAPPLYGVDQILSIFFMYGLVSVFTPILYCLALATQWSIRRVVGSSEKGAPEIAPRE